VKISRGRFKFIRLLLPGKKIYKRGVSETPMSLYEQSDFARRTRQHIQNTLDRTSAGCEISVPSPLNAPAASINGILEEVSRNISKIDQNLYSAKTCMEEILRTNSGSRESVSLN
jgi:hypothetical protein